MEDVCRLRPAALIGLLISFSVSAAPQGEGAPEVWIDGPANIQVGLLASFPDAAVDGRGRSLFVWDDANNAPATQARNILLRVFDPSGTSLIGPVQVNTFDTRSQQYARVVSSSDNSFLVVWQSDEPPQPADNFFRRVVRSQAFDANAQAVGGERLLSTSNTLLLADIDADAAALRDGGYVVVWQSAVSNGSDSGNNVQARRLGTDGAPLAPQFQVNSTLGASETFPAVADLSDGGFLVVWARPEVHGRRFLANGTANGNDFQINTSTNGAEGDVDVVRHDDGRILVVWKATDDSTDIRARLYSPNLVAQGPDFRVNTVTTGAQTVPRVAPYGRGGFFVTWQSDVSAGNDNQPDSIEGRIVTGSNQFAGAEFQVNEWISQSQQFPGVGGRNGRVAIAWKSQSNSESGNIVIEGRRWSICGIFCNGFE